MSSDDYFDDDIDSSVLKEIDILEAKATQPVPVKNTSYSSTSATHLKLQPKEIISIDSDDYDMSFNVNSSDLARLDALVDDAYKGHAGPSGGSRLSRTKSQNTIQTTLDGSVLAPNTSKAPNSATAGLSRPRTNQRNNFGISHQSRKVKSWDHTQFAKTGWKRSASSKGKGKGKGSLGNEDEEEEEVDEEDIEFEQFPAPFIPVGPIPPMKLKPDPYEARHFVYPLNRPKRDYQFNIVQHCLFENTLVALPTGLGKTFIAGVVMLNC
jgi:ATP-dependent DNA helicase MPH1